jgi:hypothetical protein
VIGRMGVGVWGSGGRGAEGEGVERLYVGREMRVVSERIFSNASIRTWWEAEIMVLSSFAGNIKYCTILLPAACCLVPCSGFRGGSSRESLERRYGTLGRQPKELPPPYHILPRSSYLLIPQDTPDLLRWLWLVISTISNQNETKHRLWGTLQHRNEINRFRPEFLKREEVEKRLRKKRERRERENRDREKRERREGEERKKKREREKGERKEGR